MSMVDEKIPRTRVWARGPKTRKRVTNRVRCPGCYTHLVVGELDTEDSVIEDHTAYGCERPDPIVNERVRSQRRWYAEQ